MERGMRRLGWSGVVRRRYFGCPVAHSWPGVLIDSVVPFCGEIVFRDPISKFDEIPARRDEGECDGLCEDRPINITGVGVAPSLPQNSWDYLPRLQAPSFRHRSKVGSTTWEYLATIPPRCSLSPHMSYLHLRPRGGYLWTTRVPEIYRAPVEH
jgi:hypothetical protein